MREHLVVSSIRSRDVGCAEWPRIRRFEHFLYLLDIVNNAFNVHASQSSSTKCEWVKRKRDWVVGHSESPLWPDSDPSALWLYSAKLGPAFVRRNARSTATRGK